MFSLVLGQQHHFGIGGYDLRVDDDLQAVGMENAADVHVKLVELVDGSRAPHVPQHAVVEHQVVGGVEGGAVPLVTVGQGGVDQGQGLLTGLDVVDLRNRGESFKVEQKLHNNTTQLYSSSTLKTTLLVKGL